MTENNEQSPKWPVRLVFIHHSCGENWLADANGGLGIALKDNNYFASDTYYGWGPDAIGDRTDIGHWWDWFCGPDSGKYMNAVYAESNKTSDYCRMEEELEGENTIVMFKSCYPNSDLKSSAGQQIPTISENPLKGMNCYSEYHTVVNAKGIYISLLEYFKTRQDKLFIAVTAPPVTNYEYAENAREFNTWLVKEWLKGYPYKNVGVFDLYNTLTGGTGDVAMYPTSDKDSHPNSVGNRKATVEFVPILNAFYKCFEATLIT